ncbi:MAG: DUF975 family protein [Clostridiales bacterium]|nr:DUF975 family protein [Candidatus Equinaster intestinalis]
MFPTSKAVKSTAIENLKGKWVKNSCAALIPVVLIIIFAMIGKLLYAEMPFKITGILLAVSALFVFVLIVCPVMLGCVRFFRYASLDKETKIGELFFYFSSKTDYLRALFFTLNFTVRIFIIGFLFMLPSFIADLAYHGRLDFLTGNVTPLWFNDLWIVSIFLRAAAVFAFAMVMLRYYLAPFIFAANDSISANEAIHLSSCASKISSIAFLSLSLSLILWIALSVLIIPMVFTLPYLFACYTAHCNFAVYHYNKSLKIQNSKETFDPDFDI